MALLVFHPKRAARSCHDCQTYIYNDDETPLERPMGSGRRVTRSPGDYPACGACPKVPKDMPPLPSSAQELSDRNIMAYQHHLECKAVGLFPDDPIVRRNAVIIQGILGEYDKKPLYDMLAMIPLLSAKR